MTRSWDAGRVACYAQSERHSTSRSGWRNALTRVGSFLEGLASSLGFDFLALFFLGF